MELEQYKKDLIKVLNSDECQTKNQMIALLEIVKFEIVKELLEE